MITIGDVPPNERVTVGLRKNAWPDDAFRASIANALNFGVGLSRISQLAGEIAIQTALRAEDYNNQRAAARLGVTDRALQLRRKTRTDEAWLKH